ncbi:hypothetical protein CC86DRAFT_389032 [Ophiobolus disseminans]|uniref:DNA 3'-5' helicase n=1 Tax=Ophiobolus disseminans TaxID=1469910 RepID=A0A6A6ZDN4_9PLEO|nr:hypothetical protein CC86DRAFT_389032 [Ophiobolus disseminans]
MLFCCVMFWYRSSRLKGCHVISATWLHKKNKKEKAIYKAMQQVLGEESVGFLSAEQELALHAVLDRQTPLVVVLPTGGGKSLLFSVPVCLEEDAGVTVVVVPYRALIDNLVSYMQKRGIDCVGWKHGQSSPAAMVVVKLGIKQAACKRLLACLQV